jgi:hypothetical protein
MKIKLKPLPKPGEERTIKKFAWFPKLFTVDKTRERIFIWLSSYYEDQEYTSKGWKWKQKTIFY